MITEVTITDTTRIHIGRTKIPTEDILPEEGIMVLQGTLVDGIMEIAVVAEMIITIGIGEFLIKIYNINCILT